MKILLKKFGTVLVSRPAGKESFMALQPFLQNIRKNEQLEIDFKGVAVLTPSWADEFITPLSNQYKVVLLNIKNPSVQATLTTLKKTKVLVPPPPQSPQIRF